jgi:hypothetical protein
MGVRYGPLRRKNMQQTKHMFEDETFLSKIQKEKILKSWCRFIIGFKFGNFTDVLYQHLHLHCRFIAHYSRQGFYQEYFKDPQDISRFLKLFEGSCPMSWRLYNRDLTSAMMQELEKQKNRIFSDIAKSNLKKQEMALDLAKRNLEDAYAKLTQDRTSETRICIRCNTIIFTGPDLIGRIYDWCNCK